MSNEVLTIDGLSLRQHGLGAATRTGRYGLPAKRGENLVLAGSSGTKFVKDKPFEEGVGAISLWAIGVRTDGSGRAVYPTTVADRRLAFEENIQKAMRLFTRPNRLSTIRTAQADGTIRVAQVEWKEWTEPEVQAGGTRAEWSISYVIPDVWWRDEALRSQAAGAGATLPKILNLTQFTGMTGIIDDALIFVTGPISNPRITDAATGQWVQYNGTLTAGQQWGVDAGSFTSVVGSTNVLAQTTHGGGSRFLSISNYYGTTDTPRLILSGSGGGAGTDLGVAAQRKWVHG